MYHTLNKLFTYSPNLHDNTDTDHATIPILQMRRQTQVRHEEPFSRLLLTVRARRWTWICQYPKWEFLSLISTLVRCSFFTGAGLLVINFEWKENSHSRRNHYINTMIRKGLHCVVLWVVGSHFLAWCPFCPKTSPDLCLWSGQVDASGIHPLGERYVSGKGMSKH